MTINVSVIGNELDTNQKASGELYEKADGKCLINKQNILVSHRRSIYLFKTYVPALNVALASSVS